MAFIPLNNGARIDMVYILDSQRVENVFHVVKPTGIQPENLTDLGGLFLNWWVNNLKPLQSNQLSLQQIDVRNLSDITAAGITYTASLPQVGGISASPPLPNNVTVAVKWLTQYRGRSYKGRSYHLGLVESFVAGNTVDANNITQLKTAYGNLVTELSAANYQLVVASYYFNKLPRLTGLATPIVSCTIDPTVDSQRRRLPGRGK